MKCYVTVNGNGIVTGFYNDDGANKDSIPMLAKEINKEVYDDWTINQSKYVWDSVQNVPIVKTIPLDFLKSQKIAEIKRNASLEISATDYKDTRHNEQLKLGIQTSLTNDAYMLLLQTRQAIRDKSNTLEAQVLASTTEAEINAVVW